MGVAIIGSSFTATRQAQLSVVAGQTVTVLARPTKAWLVVAVGQTVGSIPVSCVKHFTRAVVGRGNADGRTRQGLGRGNGRGR